MKVLGPLRVTAIPQFSAAARCERDSMAASMVWSIADLSQIFSVMESVCVVIVSTFTQAVNSPKLLRRGRILVGEDC